MSTLRWMFDALTPPPFSRPRSCSGRSVPMPSRWREEPGVFALATLCPSVASADCAA
jgi:hypothetical protein